MPGKTAPKASRLFAVYFGLAGTPPKPAQSQAGVTATAEAGGVWVENQRLRAWIGPHGAHVFEWYVKAIPGLEITEPGRGGWAGFADSMGDRGAPFEIVIEAAGPVLVRLRASSVATGTEKVFAFYADRACVEVMLSNPVGYYWDFDRVENYASDKGSPGTALFANGHREPVCGSTEQVHAMGHGVYWGAKFRGDGLLLANITPEVQALHMTGPGAGWGGVGIEGGAQAAHFVTFADQVTADPASVLNELRQTLDLRSQPKVWLAKPVLAPAAVPAR
jgi:hypothetical protein